MEAPDEQAHVQEGMTTLLSLPLDLLRPIYQRTAAYGHFGRDEPDFTWERTDKAATLRAAAGL